MKLLTFNEAKTIVQRKMDFLDILSIDLQDAGLLVRLYNGGVYLNGSFYGDSRTIVMYIRGRSYNDQLIKDFIIKLKDVGMNFNTSSGGSDFIIFTFNKHGYKTNSQFI